MKKYWAFLIFKCAQFWNHFGIGQTQMFHLFEFELHFWGKMEWPRPWMIGKNLVEEMLKKMDDIPCKSGKIKNGSNSILICLISKSSPPSNSSPFSSSNSSKGHFRLSFRPFAPFRPIWRKKPDEADPWQKMRRMARRKSKREKRIRPGRIGAERVDGTENVKLLNLN